MNLFISWSGERSKAVGKALHEWLPLVLQSLRPWFSATDIERGQQWLATLNEALDRDSFAIVCVTPENTESPWLIFETGALSRTLQSTAVCPLLIGLSPAQVRGPLAQFQSSGTSREEVRAMIDSINRSTGAPLSPTHLEILFEALWPQLETKIQAVIASPPPEAPVARPTDDVLAELLQLTRAIHRHEAVAVAERRVIQQLRAEIEAAQEKRARIATDRDELVRRKQKLDQELESGKFSGTLSTSSAERKSNKLAIALAEYQGQLRVFARLLSTLESTMQNILG